MGGFRRIWVSTSRGPIDVAAVRRIVRFFVNTKTRGISVMWKVVYIIAVVEIKNHLIVIMNLRHISHLVIVNSLPNVTYFIVFFYHLVFESNCREFVKFRLKDLRAFRQENLVVDDNSNCICNLHFQSSDYHQTTEKKPRLKVDSIYTGPKTPIEGCGTSKSYEMWDFDSENSIICWAFLIQMKFLSSVSVSMFSKFLSNQ